MGEKTAPSSERNSLAMEELVLRLRSFAARHGWLLSRPCLRAHGIAAPPTPLCRPRGQHVQGAGCCESAIRRACARIDTPRSPSTDSWRSYPCPGTGVWTTTLRASTTQRRRPLRCGAAHARTDYGREGPVRFGAQAGIEAVGAGTTGRGGWREKRRGPDRGCDRCHPRPCEAHRRGRASCRRSWQGRGCA